MASSGMTGMVLSDPSRWSPAAHWSHAVPRQPFL